MKKLLTVATRGGRLAIAQTEIISSAIRKIHPDIRIETKKITTSGDRDRRTVLWNLRDTGFFTSQVEDALLTSGADFAVHSFKDLPTRPREGLTIAAVCERHFAEDCLIAAASADSIDRLPHAARIGTSSLRRAAQLKHLRPDLEPTPVRGNVQTRINLLDKGKVDAVILARAGIERLGLGGKISFCFDTEQFIPAPAQGALAVQTRTDDITTGKLIAAINDKNASTVTLAERQVLTTMQCGCHAPVGAFAKVAGDYVEITAFISDLQGKNFIKRHIKGPAEQATDLAEKIANELLSSGGSEILASLEQ
jgi:hydroxymethylbilane synthase